MSTDSSTGLGQCIGKQQCGCNTGQPEPSHLFLLYYLSVEIKVQSPSRMKVFVATIIDITDYWLILDLAA